MKSVKDNVEGKNLIEEERSFDNFNSLLLDNSDSVENSVVFNKITNPLQQKHTFR